MCDESFITECHVSQMSRFPSAVVVEIKHGIRVFRLCDMCGTK